jgi:DsbC/DsbD-like thiol-disulfide interchange protein
MVQRLAQHFAFANERNRQKFATPPASKAEANAGPLCDDFPAGLGFASRAPGGRRHCRESRKHAGTLRPHDHVSSACARFILDSAMLGAPAVKLTFVTATLVGVAGILPARAQDASAWQKEAHSATRLLAGTAAKTADGAVLRAGIEIRLDSGWRTYWRYPGDSGAPPTFDFAGSDNVKSAQVEFPAPERFPDGAGGNSIGYRDDVILPLRIVPADATRPAALHVKINYEACGTMCVPAQATLDLVLGSQGAEEATVEKAEQLVPKRAALGPIADHALAILSVHREPGAPHERVEVEVAAPAGAPVELFVEGPTPEWALPLPEPAGPTNGPTRRFAFELDGLPPGAQAKGAALTLTAVSGSDAIEVPNHLD